MFEINHFSKISAYYKKLCSNIKIGYFPKCTMLHRNHMIYIYYTPDSQNVLFARYKSRIITIEYPKCIKLHFYQNKKNIDSFYVFNIYNYFVYALYYVVYV